MNSDRMTSRLQSLALIGLVSVAIGGVGGARAAGAQTQTQTQTQVQTDGPRITLRLPGADIREALRMVAKQAGVDLVMSNLVTGEVALELEEATLEEALDAIVHVGGFEHTRRGSIVMVSTLTELIERERQLRELQQGRTAEVAAIDASQSLEATVFELRYIDAERAKSVIDKLLSAVGSASVLMTADHLARGGERGGAEPVESQFQIGTQLSTTSAGQPARSHTLVVIDTPERLERVRTVIGRVDVKPAQILIEARFVEILLGDDQRLGIDWNVVASAAGAASPHTFPFLGDSLGAADPQVDGGSPNGVFPPAPNSVTLPGEPGLFTFGTLDFTSFTAVLRMIQRNSSVQIVSNPRVVVDDRHTATILVGERYPILSANISEFGTVTEQLDHYEPIGVQLEVTPSVLEDGEVALIVRPSTSSLGPAVEGSTGLSVARISARQIDTSVTVRDSETIVLGGLITSRESETEGSVPFFGAIPLLGRLFRSSSTSAEKVELVVFLTVTVLERQGLSEREQAMFEGTTVPTGDPNAHIPPRSELELSPPSPRF